jgi:hypothetical protein
VTIGEQLAPSRAPLFAAVVMALAAWAAMQLVDAKAPLMQIFAAVAVGVVVYPLALAAVSPKARRVIAAAASLPRVGRSQAAKALKAEFGIQP